MAATGVQVGTGASESYKDSSEDWLLRFFSRPVSQSKLNKLLSGPLSWPIYYHLTPFRENILNWYPLHGRETILEIGAGCGAVTGTLLERSKKVVALELSPKRAAVLAKRHRSHKNLEVVAANLESYNHPGGFDVVTSIGVLEYSGLYINEANPFTGFLRHTHRLLKPRGTLLLAIENRLGLKYWAGAPEDHTGRFFDSIEGYPFQKDIRTFGRAELISMLTDAGFSQLKFYYPFPDYKLPIEVYSDEYLPTADNPLELSASSTSPDPRATREYFSDLLAYNSIIANGLFPHMANSFLVEATK